MKAKKLNKLGFRFSDDLDINLFSLITENADLIEAEGENQNTARHHTGILHRR